MRKAIGWIAASLLMAACMDRSVPTSPGRGIVASGASHDDNPVVGAVFTSTNPTDDHDATNNHDLCQNQKDSNAPAINCNIYFDKSFVWLSGGPDPSGLGAGTYVFAVLDPGGQGDPNDCTDGNLSDVDPCASSSTGAGDDWTHRVYSVDANGTITYPAAGFPGGHDFNGNMIRLTGYDNTTNSGGEYIMAVCNLAGRNELATNGPGVDPKLCKYDAFKVDASKPCPNAAADDCQFHTPATLSIEKTIDTKWNRTFKWGITKGVDKTSVSQVGGTVTFTYTLTVTHDDGTDDLGYSGTVKVTNTSSETAHHVVITDPNAPSLSCAPFVNDSDLAAGGVVNCTYSETPTSTASITNTAKVAWTSVDVNGNPTAPFETAQKVGTFTETDIDACVDVKDPNAPNPPLPTNVCNTATSPITINYSRTISVKADECDNYDNTATIYRTGLTTVLGSDSKTVTVCGGVAGGLTMGFWQNKNGQAIITGGSSLNGVCKSGTWLRLLAPFSDLSATASCAQVGTYVTNIIKSANASGAAMNAMLKGQMLATALDVYFSDPALGTNKIGAPSPIGGVKVDLTKICKMIDGSGGTSTCSGTYSNTSAAFGGASSMLVSYILAYAASQSNGGGSIWYGQVKATQELAKNTFDAINNGVALTAP